jgi:4-hydroxyphenylacetate 3-monooxygenase
MVKAWMDATCGMFGRSPNFMNINLLGLAAAHEAFGEKDKRYGENVWNYYILLRSFQADDRIGIGART